MDKNSQTLFNIRLSRPYKMIKGFLPSFLLSGVRLRHINAEQRRSRSLALWICEASVVRVHKLAKARGRSLEIGICEVSEACIKKIGQRLSLFWRVQTMYSVPWEKYPCKNSNQDRLAEIFLTPKHDKRPFVMFVGNYDLGQTDAFQICQSVVWTGLFKTISGFG